MADPAPPPAYPLRRTRLGSGSYPRGHFDLALVGIALFGLAAVAWLVTGILALAVRRFDVALLVPPVLLALAIGVGQTDLPLRARFAAARPAFENAVAARGRLGRAHPVPAGSAPTRSRSV